MLIVTHVHMLHFTKYYKDAEQVRLTIFISLCFKFIDVHVF